MGAAAVVEKLQIEKKRNGFEDKRPTDLIYALMSQQAYAGSIKEGDSLPEIIQIGL